MTPKGDFMETSWAGDYNLLGLNKSMWASTEISQIGYRGDLGIANPGFWEPESSRQ